MLLFYLVSLLISLFYFYFILEKKILDPQQADMFANLDDNDTAPFMKKQKTSNQPPKQTKSSKQTQTPQSQTQNQLSSQTTTTSPITPATTTPTPPPTPQPLISIPSSLPDKNTVEVEEEVEEDVEWDEYEVELSGERSSNFDPVHLFNHFGFPSVLTRNIKHIAQYKLPTPVQRYSIPVVLAKRDLLATAQTGSGKTGAFLLPIISRLLTETKVVKPLSYFKVFPLALIIVPTRELALQIYQESIKVQIDFIYL
jgi:hypothetical protein